MDMKKRHLEVELEDDIVSAFTDQGWECLKELPFKIDDRRLFSADIALFNDGQLCGYVECCSDLDDKRARRLQMYERLKPELFVLTDGRIYEVYIDMIYAGSMSAPLDYACFRMKKEERISSQPLTEIVGPLLEIIRKMEKANPEEKAALELQLYAIGEQVEKDIKGFDAQFRKLQNSQLQNEEKLRQINEALDRRLNELLNLDYDQSRSRCMQAYRNFWNKLDQHSQDYLIMSDYLYKQFSQMSDCDFSSSVYGYGRAIENELNAKIFAGYIKEVAADNEGMADIGKVYVNVKSAIREYKTTGKYFVSPISLLNCLKNLGSDEYPDNSYRIRLNEYLSDNNIDKRPISTESFIDEANVVLNDYRNRSVHSNTDYKDPIIPIFDAEVCRQKSEEVLTVFMSALH